MAGNVTIDIKDNISPELQRLARKTQDFSRVMGRIESEILRPIRSAALGASELQSRSGELFGAVQTWSGKVSAGISLRSKSGRDLIIAKAITHTQGAKKGSFGRQRKSAYKVKGYSTGGRKVKSYTKKQGIFPWGNIPAREFFPDEGSLVGKKEGIVAMIVEDLQNA